MLDILSSVNAASQAESCVRVETRSRTRLGSEVGGYFGQVTEQLAEPVLLTELVQLGGKDDSCSKRQSLGSARLRSFLPKSGRLRPSIYASWERCSGRS